MIIVSIPYAVIKKTIDEWDPIGLLITHAPADEYDSESNRIYDRLNELSYASIETLANIIFEAFIKSFGDDVFISGFDECKKIAEKILT
ncbi:MAG TPA: DUF1871 domain-containing protein [Clostridium sp.]|nr:DUF1871 domain-containing protein [Clostridium sp.]